MEKLNFKEEKKEELVSKRLVVTWGKNKKLVFNITEVNCYQILVH